MNRVLFASDKTEWSTPQAFFDALNAEFHFTLDAAATAENAKCTRYYTEQDNALSQVWSDVVWCNPPYGRDTRAWFAKAREAQQQGATVVMLVPARTDTKWWHEHVQGIASEVRFVKGRLKFGGSKNSAPFPSAVIIYRPEIGAHIGSNR